MFICILFSYWFLLDTAINIYIYSCVWNILIYFMCINIFIYRFENSFNGRHWNDGFGGWNIPPLCPVWIWIMNRRCHIGCQCLCVYVFVCVCVISVIVVTMSRRIYTKRQNHLLKILLPSAEYNKIRIDVIFASPRHWKNERTHE